MMGFEVFGLWIWEWIRRHWERLDTGFRLIE